ncbi:hypothetical protein ACF1BE_26730 [Streptomyces sp. NPDC014991]
MSARRGLVTDSRTAHGIRAIQADLLDALPAVRAAFRVTLISR